MIDYDAELQLHAQRLRRAYDIRPADRVLDIGCGTGQTTRDAARMVPNGEALGVDIDALAIARARELAEREFVRNARFEAADAQVHPFKPMEFDVALSRFGTMFFADASAAFGNVARAMKARGRLVMMVWQARDRNEWAVSIDRAVGPSHAQRGIYPRPGIDPFSLGEPATVRRVLTSAGFTDVALTDVDVPVFYGPDIDAALDFVSHFSMVSRVLERSDPLRTASVVASLRAMLAAHASERGVWFDSRSWIVTARRSALGGASGGGGDDPATWAPGGGRGRTRSP